MLDHSRDKVTFRKAKVYVEGSKKRTVVQFTDYELNELKQLFNSLESNDKLKQHICYYPFVFLMHFGCRPNEARQIPFNILDKDQNIWYYKLQGHYTKTG